MSAFIVKLFAILENEEPEIIRWIRDGSAFKVLDQRRFVGEVLPKYFRHARIESFQRQLNLYGFKRVSRGEDMGAYYHSMCVRGRRDLIRNIRFPSYILEDSQVVIYILGA